MTESRLHPGVLAALAACCLVGCGERQPPNIVLIVVDTLRADRLGCYGYPLPTSPHIDRLAERGTLFEDASSVAAYTRPSTASIFTGLYPSVHGAVTHADSISGGVPTLTEALRDAGYETHGIYRNGNVSETFGFGRGFESYRSPDKRFWRELKKTDPAKNANRLVSYTDDSLLAREAVPYIQGVETGPFFLYLHLSGPHDPYSPPRDVLAPFLNEPLTETAELFYHQPVKLQRQQPAVLQQIRKGMVDLDDLSRRQIHALYDGEVAFSDRQIGAVVGALEAAGLLDDTLIVVTSDHGEELWDHGDIGHGQSHYRELLHVPLIFAGPGVRQRRIPTAVSLIDLAPTLLELAEVEAPGGLSGRSLVPVLSGRRQRPAEVPVYAEGLLRLLGNGDPIQFRSLQSGHLKLILDFQRHRKALFDLDTDRGETRNWIAGERNTSRALIQTLVDIHQANLDSSYLAPVTAVEIPAEVEEQIRALGYLGQTEDSASSSQFRAPLRVVDTDAHGFLGYEREGRDYVAKIDFSQPVSSAEQLLYGWAKQRPEQRSRGMTTHAGARLGREEAHASWTFRGHVPKNERSVSLLVRIDGDEASQVPLTAGEPFEISGRLPPGRSFVRFDFECRRSAADAANADLSREGQRCLVAEYLGLD